MHRAIFVLMVCCLGQNACVPSQGRVDAGTAISVADGGAGGDLSDAGLVLRDGGQPREDGGDGGAEADAGMAADAGPGQDAALAPDAGSPGDGGSVLPLQGFGQISGECDVLDTELSDASPHFFVSNLNFADDPFDIPEDVPHLTDGGQEILADGNLGGSSEASEIFAYEMLARCENAALLKSENEIQYLNAMGKKTDLLVSVDGVLIGVSVTRAMVFPPADTYPLSNASDLLTRKLDGVRAASENVHPDDRWQKQILSVLAYGPDFAESLRQAWNDLDAETKADTIVYVTVTDGDDGFIY